MFPSLHQYAAFDDLRLVLWYLYLVAAVMLPAHHVRPIVKYLRGGHGIGDACIRTEAIQCGWRVPALLFSIFVAPSLPLFLSIFLDLVGRIGRVLAMGVSERRWSARSSEPERRNPAPRASAFSPTGVVFGDTIPITRSHRFQHTRDISSDDSIQDNAMAVASGDRRADAATAAATH